MTIADLKEFIEDLPDDMLVVTDQYNDGYGGQFEADSFQVVKTYWISELGHYSDGLISDKENMVKVLLIG